MKMGKRKRLIAAGAAFSLRLATASAATVTLTVSDGYDDAEDDGNGDQYIQEYDVWAGRYYGSVPPYNIGAFRFASIPLPKDTVISNAYLRVMAYANGTGASTFTIVGEDYDNPDAYAYAPYIGERTPTSATVSWGVSSAWQKNYTYTSPNIKTIVQEIVNRSGWSYGNALAIQLRNAASSGGYQKIYSKEGADYAGGTPAQLIIEYAGEEYADTVKSENYIPGATNATSSVPLYLNNPDMYYPAESAGICWATAAADIFAYWDRVAYGGVTYWNLIDNGTAPLRQPSLPSAPGHDQADVKSAVAWLAYQYYVREVAEDGILEEFANQTNGLSFQATYHAPVNTTAERTAYFGTIMSEINAGRPLSIGSYGTYFGGGHQVPVIGYREQSNAVNSMVYIHLNTGGTQSQYVNPYASSWGYLDMDQIVPGGTPVDQYEAAGDNTAATAVALQPDDIYAFRQTHNFSVTGDVDWIRLDTVSGRKYVIATTNLGASCDTVLGVYATNGVTLLLQDDDGGTEARSSKIEFRCWSTGTHFLRLNDKADGSGHAANYDVQVSYSTITNEAPTALSLSPSAVAENQASGTVVGTFSTTDPDVGNTFTYSLVSGSGSGDNAVFTVSGNTLKTAAVFDYEAKSSYAVRVRTTDQNSLYYEKAFTVSVTNVTDAGDVTVRGTPCLWLDQYGLVAGGDYEGADTGDVDGDGLAAWQEWVAGTVPTNAASVFLAGWLQVDGELFLHWTPDLTGAVPARVYSVYGAVYLTNGFPATPFTNIPAGSPLSLPSLSTNRFFRVGVGLEP